MRGAALLCGRDWRSVWRAYGLLGSDRRTPAGPHPSRARGWCNRGEIRQGGPLDHVRMLGGLGGDAVASGNQGGLPEKAISGEMAYKTQRVRAAGLVGCRPLVKSQEV